MGIRVFRFCNVGPRYPNPMEIVMVMIRGWFHWLRVGLAVAGVVAVVAVHRLAAVEPHVHGRRLWQRREIIGQLTVAWRSDDRLDAAFSEVVPFILHRPPSLS